VICFIENFELTHHGTVGIFVLMDENYQFMIEHVGIEFDVRKPANMLDEFRIQLTAAVLELLRSDFPRLVQILYRLDVSEEKLKEQLKSNQETGAAVIIAEMIIERQLQKVEARKKSGGNENISDEEKW